jgi:hypothetical protein
VLAGIVLIATTATTGAFHLLDGEGMRYSDYGAVVACLRDLPRNPAQTDAERYFGCATKVVTERIGREHSQEK